MTFPQQASPSSLNIPKHLKAPATTTPVVHLAVRPTAPCRPPRGVRRRAAGTKRSRRLATASAAKEGPSSCSEALDNSGRMGQPGRGEGQASGRTGKKREGRHVNVGCLHCVLLT